MNGLSRLPSEAFDWMVEPILNRDTRLSMVANAATGALMVQGWEVDGAATGVLAHREPAANSAEALETALLR